MPGAGLRTRGRSRRVAGRIVRRTGAGSGLHLRLHDLQRLVGPRPPSRGDERRPRPGQGQGFRYHARPFLVTADELDPLLTADGLLDIDGTVSVNGTVSGRDNLRNMSWSFDELLAQASRGARVRGGGTSSGPERWAMADVSGSSGVGPVSARRSRSSPGTWSR